MDIIYTVLYTHQKTKKAKTWQDGTLKILATGTKAVLCDDKGSKLDALHIHASDVVTGEQLESDRYYIQVEELQKQSCSPSANTATVSARFSQHSQSSASDSKLDQCQSAAPTANPAQRIGVRGGAGLKRKRTGFIPPRLVRPRPAEDIEPSPESDMTFQDCSSDFFPKSFHTNHQNNPASGTLFGGVKPLSGCASNNESIPSTLGRGRIPAHLSMAGPFTSPGSSQTEDQPAVMKNSPWRTFGQLSVKSSPLQVLSPENRAQSGKRDQNAGRFVNCSTAPDINEETSVSSSLIFSSKNPWRSQTSEDSFPGNPARQQSCKLPLKRSASEIIALIRRKKNKEESVNTESLPLDAGQRVTDSAMVERLPQASANCQKSSKTDFENCKISQNHFSPSASVSAVETVKGSPIFGHSTKSCGKDFTSPLCSSSSFKTVLTPKLSGSISSLSKDDFEDEEGCFEGDSLTSPQSVRKSQSQLEIEASQSVSDFDQSQQDSQDAMTKAEHKSADCRSARLGNTSCFAEPEKESFGNEMKCMKHGSDFSQENNNVVTESRHSEEDRILKNTFDDQDTECAKTVEADVAACFEMSFSPLSEEAGLIDKDCEDIADPDVDDDGDPSHPLCTDSGQELIDMKMCTADNCDMNCASHMKTSEQQLSKNSDTSPRSAEKLCQDEKTEAKRTAREVSTSGINTSKAMIDSLHADENDCDESKVAVTRGGAQDQISGNGDENTEACIQNMEMFKTEGNAQQLHSSQNDSGTVGIHGNIVFEKSAGIGCLDDHSDVCGDMKTLDDLYMSPDSVTLVQPSYQNICVSNNLPPTMVTEKKLCSVLSKDDRNRGKWSPDHTLHVNAGHIYGSETHNRNKNDQQRDDDSVRTLCQSRTNEANPIVLSSPSDQEFPSGSAESKLTVSSPTSFKVPDDSPDSNMFDLCTFVSSPKPIKQMTSSSYGCDKIVESISKAAEIKVSRLASPSYCEQRLPTTPQSTPCDSDFEREHQIRCDGYDCESSLSSGPGLRFFQTVSEVIGKMERNTGVSVSSSRPVEQDSDEDPTSVLQVKKLPKMHSHPNRIEETDCQNRFQHVSSTLPHPDRLLRLRGPSLETTMNRHLPSTAAADDITQTISARLIGYKMQGMVTSDVVERPMAYRCQAGEDQNIFPSVRSLPAWHSFHTHEENTSSFWPGFGGEVTGSGSVHISKPADENVMSPSVEGKRGHTQVLNSFWTPETSPADEITRQKLPQGQVPQHDDDSQQTHHKSQNANLLQVSSHTDKNTSCYRFRDQSPDDYNATVDVDDNSSALSLLDQIQNMTETEEKCPKLCDKQVLENSCSNGIHTTRIVSSNNDSQISLFSPQVNSNKSLGVHPQFSGMSEAVPSPQLFTQNFQPPASTILHKPVQRERKLRPVLTAPDDTVLSMCNTQTNTGSEGKESFAVEDGNLEVMDVSSGGKSPYVCANKQSTSNVSSSRKNNNFQPVTLSLNCSTDDREEIAFDNVENAEFSVFDNNYPMEDQLSDVQNRVSYSKSPLNEGNSHADYGLGTVSEEISSGHIVGNSRSVLKERNGKTIEECRLEIDICSASSSSPQFVIANSGLDLAEELEEEDWADDGIVRKGVKKHSTPLPDNEQGPSSNTQLKRKASRFASHFQSVQSLGRQNYSDPSNRTDQTAFQLVCDSSSGNFLRLHKNSLDADHLLTPAVPTDSPPLDISPDRPSKNFDECGIRNDVDHPQTLQRPYISLTSKNHPTSKHPVPQNETDSDKGQIYKYGQKNFSPVQSHVQSMQICPEYVCPTPERTSPQQACQRFSDGRPIATARKVGLGKFKKPSGAVFNSCLPHNQSNLCHELQFSGREEVESQATPVRQVVIPPSFDSVASYKQILVAALTEFLNIQLFGLAKTYHCALSKVDVSAFTEGANVPGKQDGGSNNPICKCGNVSKVVQVKKEGPNKGRFFYTCSAPRGKQCKFFQWVDQQNGSGITNRGAGLSLTKPKFSDPNSIMSYFRGQSLSLFCQCHFVRRADNRQGFPAWVRHRPFDSTQKKSIFIRLPRKDSATSHAKDDLWVVSKSLSFAKGETFVARSTFHGPSTHGEVAVDPVSGYSASLWTDGSVCHALHCGNAATELTCMANIRDYVDMTSLPVLSHLLSSQPCTGLSSRMSNKGFKAPMAQQNPGKLHVPAQFVHDLAAEFISEYQLNTDQALALRRAADMMNKDAKPNASVLLIHGVFGAGKSFLLSVLILFLVELFHQNDTYSPGVPFPWKLLLSSTTNVAVDRVLQGLLELGFDDFVRVGSVKKIAKPVLPYSVHASGSDSQELRDLQEMLKSQDITPAEKHCVRKSIERQKLGENRKRLGAVRVVGVTCAACSFQCLDKMKFPFVVLDECSQMTEPASLLPIARFSCEKLVLVGDPKQLDPTLQGSDAAHGEGLEQTLFDRLMKMGHDPVILRTQYRCHPVISAVSNSLFYESRLQDGVTADDRQPLLDLFPTLCFYNISSGQEQSDSSGSFVNEVEAQFVCLLLSVLVAQGMQTSSIGVITLYKAQARQILDIIRRSKDEAARGMTSVQVSTVDAFQGGERDVIILSCVRTHSVGFIDCDKRMNVALTRARHHLLIVGHQRNLSSNRRWAQVIGCCQGVPDGVVSATAASRQLQAVLDQVHENHQEPHPSGSDDKQLSGAKHSVRGNRRGSEKGSDSPVVNDASSPASSVVVISPPPVQTKGSPHSQSSPQSLHEISLHKQSFAGKKIPDCEDVKHSEESETVKKCAVSRQKYSRVKPLVIDSDDNGSSSDESLPDGL